MKRIIYTGVLLALLLSLCGCETFKGLGRDMGKAGSWIEKKAEQGD